MLAPFLFIKSVGSWKIEGSYSRHYMLYFALLWVVVLEDYYPAIKDKYPNFYVRSSGIITTFQFTDTNEEEVEEISNILCYIST